MKNNKTHIKLFSLLLSLVMASSCMCITAKAAEAEYLSFYMDGFLITTDYYADEYYAVEKEVSDGYKTEVYNNMGELVEIFELSEEEETASTARGIGNVTRTFSSEKVVTVLGVGLYGLRHTVILDIYVYDYFREIQRVISEMVTAADGMGVYEVENAVSAVSAPNGYPSTTVDCTATASCVGSIEVSDGIEETFGITVKELVNSGIGHTSTVGSTVYFRKTISHNWSISLY